jgi:hypothetical protein
MANIIVNAITLIIIHFSVQDVFNKLSNLGEKIHLSSNHPYFNFISNSRELMSIKLSWVFGVSIFLTAIVSIYISHKVAGPIYKLRKFLIGINNKESNGPLKFRKGDFYSDLPAIVNEAIKISKE